MVKSTFDGEILTEGYKSYHKALFAVIEFRRQAAYAIGLSLKSHLANLAHAMVIDQNALGRGVAYTTPDKISQSYDGTDAEVGFRMPGDLKHPWQMYVYLWVGEEAPCQLLAQVTFKQH